MGETWIIIVSYNGMEWIQQCLDSTKPYSVIVVDNNSIDGTSDFIKNNYPKVILIERNENLGFGKANNIGISHALKLGADFVFLLNQDAYLVPDTIKRLVAVQKENLDYGVVSPIHLNGKGNKLDYKFSKYLLSNIELYSDYIINNKLKEIYPLNFVNAAGWLISKDCLKIVGGFDPLFFHYCEDDNYCQRLIYHGLKIGVVPNSFLKHDREDRIFKSPKDRAVEYLENAERETKKRFADLNKPDFKGLKNIIRKRRNIAIKSLLKMDFKAFKLFLTEYKILKNIYPDIKKSYLLNKKKGPNYL